MTITVSPDLQLPDAAVTETFAILAKRGAGKSNAAVVMAEQMHDAGLPWVAVDPKGDWWGVRSSRTGKSAGLPVLVLGGEHGDVPLEATAGALVADLLVEQRISAVVDLSLFSKRETRQFLTAFADRLYRANRAPLHVFAEEAHEYIPQRVMGDDAAMVGMWERLVKWGRTHGLGVTLITQRSASLNKDVLTQVETLIAMRTTGPTDQAAVKAWVDQHDAGREVVAALRGLDNGEAFIIGPRLLGQDEPRRIRFAQRRTFDSGATPEPGAAPVTPRTVADVDLAAFKEAMAETIEKAKADDPKTLRARIRELEKQLAERPEAEPERVQVPVITDEQMVTITDTIQRWDTATAAVDTVFDLLRVELQRIQTPTEKKAASTREGQAVHRGGSAPRRPGASSPGESTTPGAAAGKTRPGRSETRPDASVGTVSRPQQKILDALAWFTAVGIDQPTRGQVAFQARVSPKSSGFEKNCSTLRTGGLVAYPGSNRLTLTIDGRGVAAWPEQPGTSAELQQAFYDGVTGPQARLLLILVHCYPETLERQHLADMADVSAVSSGFEKNLSTLRSLGLIDYPTRGAVAATDLLFLN